MFFDIVHHLFTYRRFVNTTWPRGHWPRPIFVDIIRDLFTYQRFIYTMWPRGYWNRRHVCWHSISFIYISKVYLHHVTAWGKVIRHICWHSTSFVYISEAKVRFIYTTSPPGARTAAIFVDILHHFRSRGHWPRRHVCLHHVTCD